MARIEIQSGTDKDCVSKLSYQVTGSVCIVYHTGRVCYCVKRLSNPRSSKMKYMVEDLYTLSPSILPCEQIDGRDTRYLNHSRQPTINPFKIHWMVCYIMIFSFHLLFLHYHPNGCIILKHYNFHYNVP